MYGVVRVAGVGVPGIPNIMRAFCLSFSFFESRFSLASSYACCPGLYLDGHFLVVFGGYLAFCWISTKGGPCQDVYASTHFPDG